MASACRCEHSAPRLACRDPLCDRCELTAVPSNRARSKRLAKHPVEMDRSSRARRTMRAVPRFISRREHPRQINRLVGARDIDTPARKLAKDAALRNRLIRPAFVQFCRAVCAHNDQWRATLRCLNDCRQEVGDGGSRCCDHHRRATRRARRTERNESCSALIVSDQRVDFWRARDSMRQWSAARSRTNNRQ